MKRVLITGGSGLVGTQLTSLIQTQGVEVVWLVRKKNTQSTVLQIQWSELNTDESIACLKTIGAVVHLSGAGVFDKPWSKAYKKTLFESRVDTAQRLLAALHLANVRLDCFVSASGIAAYGNKIITRPLDESISIDRTSYLGELVYAWEAAADQFASISKRVVKARFGIILSNQGGAYPQLANKIMGTMAYLGSGKQFANWVHIEDVVGFISETLFHEKRHGIYNVVAPNNCTHFTFMKKVATSHHAYLMPIGVPALLLKAVLGSEKASVLIGGGNVSAERILKSGFHFKYPTLDEALNVLK